MTRRATFLIVLSASLLLAAQGPHDYQVTPRDAITVKGADLFVINGLGLDDTFTARLLPAARTNVWTVAVVPGDRFVYALRREGTDRRGFCRIGSVKTNIGHTDTAAGVEDALAREQREHELRSRQRRQAQEEVDLRAEPTAVDQNETFAALRELVRQLHRDTAAERVADECRALVSESDQQIAHPTCVRAERVVASRLG